MNTTTITRNVDMNLDAVENILISTAKRCLKIKTAKKRHCETSSNKKWFDKEWRYKRHELPKLSNHKHRDPRNNTLREEYHNVLKQYKNLVKHKRNEYHSNKICELENTVENSNNKSFGTFWSQWTTLWRKPSPLQFLKKNGCPTFNLCTRMNLLTNSRRQLLMSWRIKRILANTISLLGLPHYWKWNSHCSWKNQKQQIFFFRQNQKRNDQI